jgi:hypothetical protein
MFSNTTSPTGGGRSVGIVRSRTKATEFSLILHEGKSKIKMCFIQNIFIVVNMKAKPTTSACGI